MGIPYSREINAAFDQVTPLVAAGFKVLKTTKNISIILAVIQVLTVVCLALILVVLLGILYSVNPDLEHERKHMVTPFFRSIAHMSFVGIVESIAASLIGFGGFVAMAFFFVKERQRDDLEVVGNGDVDKALEDLNEEDKKSAGKKKKKKSKEGKSGKEKADEEEN